MESITGIVITLNEQENIEKCIQSIKWVDELIVVDTGSSDNTIELARKYANFIYKIPFNNNFGELREKALNKAKCDWVLMIDADETLPKSSEKNIRRIITSENINGFWFPRRQYINRRDYLKYGYFYPDYQLRLFKKKNVHYIGKVHEFPNIPKNNTKINSDVEIYHNPSKTKFNSFFSIKRMLPYIDIEAEVLAKTNNNISLVEGITELIRHTYRSFIKLQGYKDGYKGFRAACIYGLIVIKANKYKSR